MGGGGGGRLLPSDLARMEEQTKKRLKETSILSGITNGSHLQKSSMRPRFISLSLMNFRIQIRILSTSLKPVLSQYQNTTYL